MKPLIYLAGPITRPDPMVNMAEAVRIADRLMFNFPIVLFTPQLSVLHQAVSPKTHEGWLDYDFSVIENCAAILRIQGRSIGADMETIFAEGIDIPVFVLDDEGKAPARFARWLEQYMCENRQHKYPLTYELYRNDAAKDARAVGEQLRSGHPEGYGHVG